MGKYIRKRIDAFGYAFCGIKQLFTKEAHAKIHLVAAILVIIAGFLFNISRIEWCLIALCVGGVFMAEGFNTAIERVCDKVSPEKNSLIKDAKDIAAAAVFLFVMAAVVVGLIVFLPKIVDKFR
ncbi:MAG: diacylglycerol kinase family protein [Muribaculaceae bacterium]|nr:diacylglycerol kinase family protein [Muribaculaceae bacterium]